MASVASPCRWQHRNFWRLFKACWFAAGSPAGTGCESGACTALPWAGGASEALLVHFPDSCLSLAASPASPTLCPRPSLCSKVRQLACAGCQRKLQFFHCCPGLVQRLCSKQKRCMLGLCSLKFPWTGNKFSDLQTIQHSKFKPLSS